MNLTLSATQLMMIIFVAAVSSAALRSGEYKRPREAFETDIGDHTAYETNLRHMQKPWQNFKTGSKKKGQYIPSNDAKYIHVPDMRELGKYVHIPFPYNGGYGPYSGLNGIPYEYDPAGEYSFDKYHTTKPTTTTTPRPKRTYDDEGKWKIIRQDEKKQEKKYQYLYETENGIYAEEHAVIGEKHSTNAGTSGTGYYQYIGDDDRIYRVEYTVGEQGYVPKLIILDNPLSNRTTSKSKGFSRKTTPFPKKIVEAAVNHRSSSKYPRKSITTPTSIISNTMAPTASATKSLDEMPVTTILPLLTPEHPQITTVSTALDTLIPSSTTSIEAETQTLTEELPFMPSTLKVIITTMAPLVDGSSEQEIAETVTFDSVTNMLNNDENISNDVTLQPNTEENINFR